MADQDSEKNEGENKSCAGGAATCKACRCIIDCSILQSCCNVEAMLELGQR